MRNTAWTESHEAMTKPTDEETFEKLLLLQLPPYPQLFNCFNCTTVY